jgi:hypothetical protein
MPFFHLPWPKWFLCHAAPAATVMTEKHGLNSAALNMAWYGCPLSAQHGVFLRGMSRVFGLWLLQLDFKRTEGMHNACWTVQGMASCWFLTAILGFTLHFN